MSRSPGRWQALLLGTVVLVGTGLGVFGFFAVGSRGWFGDEALDVRTGFDAIRGVEVGTRVRIQGIDAGEVAAIDPPAGPGRPVMLHLRLRGDYRHLVLAGSTVQIVSEGLIGAKVVEIRSDGVQAGTADATPVASGAVLRSVPTVELTELLGEVNRTLQSLRESNGTLSKLVNDSRAYDALVAMLQQSKDTMNSLQQDAETIKRLPVVRGYVEDPIDLLVRPRCERHRQVIAETELFEPGRAVLTDAGRQRLDELAPWLENLKVKGSDVVVAAYADPAGGNPALARTVTRQQSEAVVDYLRDKHGVQKMGWFRSRSVRAMGLGAAPPPAAEVETLPASRIEIMVFVPR